MLRLRSTPSATVNGKGALGESRDRLRPAVVVELEVAGPQSGDRFSGTIGHRGVHLDGLHPAREPRLRLFLGLRARRRGQADQRREHAAGHAGAAGAVRPSGHRGGSNGSIGREGYKKRSREAAWYNSA